MKDLKEIIAESIFDIVLSVLSNLSISDLRYPNDGIEYVIVCDGLLGSVSVIVTVSFCEVTASLTFETVSRLIFSFSTFYYTTELYASNDVLHHVDNPKPFDRTASFVRFRPLPIFS